MSCRPFGNTQICSVHKLLVLAKDHASISACLSGCAFAPLEEAHVSLAAPIGAKSHANDLLN